MITLEIHCKVCARKIIQQYLAANTIFLQPKSDNRVTQSLSEYISVVGLGTSITFQIMTTIVPTVPLGYTWLMKLVLLS